MLDRPCVTNQEAWICKDSIQVVFMSFLKQDKPGKCGLAGNRPAFLPVFLIDGEAVLVKLLRRLSQDITKIFVRRGTKQVRIQRSKPGNMDLQGIGRTYFLLDAR